MLNMGKHGTLLFFLASMTTGRTRHHMPYLGLIAQQAEGHRVGHFKWQGIEREGRPAGGQAHQETGINRSQFVS